jgi:hypothetical protein
MNPVERSHDGRSPPVNGGLPRDDLINDQTSDRANHRLRILPTVNRSRRYAIFVQSNDGPDTPILWAVPCTALTRAARNAVPENESSPTRQTSRTN